MLELPNVTLICLTNKDIEAHQAAIDESCKGIVWGAIKLIENPELNTIDKWNRAVVFDLWRYVDTDFAMLIHADGYVINAHAWQDEFLAYDYIGAPWPLPKDDFSYRDVFGNLQRVGNSVSLRSKKLLRLPYNTHMEWKAYHGFTNEDGYICVNNRHLFEEAGCKFAPLELAKYFSKEHSIPENRGITTFAFHSL